MLNVGMCSTKIRTQRTDIVEIEKAMWSVDSDGISSTRLLVASHNKPRLNLITTRGWIS